MRLQELNTPSLVLDTHLLLRNIERMARRCRELGVRLRPHVKTPKSIPVARLLSQAGASGFTVSTLQEAEYLAASGFDDLFYAVPLDPHKVPRAAALLRRNCKLSLLIDSLEAARLSAARARAEGVVLPLWIELDVDHYRTGISSSSSELGALVDFLLADPSLRLSGLMSYAGASYKCSTPHAAADLAEAHRLALLHAAESVRARGAPAPPLSFGSTPAVLHARSLEGISEVRCGIYAFQDLFQAGIGACSIDDIALSVLAAVVSRNLGLNRFAIDAGGLALSKDRSTQGETFDAGFGLVCDCETGRVIDDLYVAAVSQELGIVTSRNGQPLDFERFGIGSRVRVLPNHADMTAAAYEEYSLIDGTDTVQGRWERTNRW